MIMKRYYSDLYSFDCIEMVKWWPGQSLLYYTTITHKKILLIDPGVSKCEQIVLRMEELDIINK